MKLVIGLGNPGEKYTKTRHNVGFMVIDRIIRELMVSPHMETKLDSLIFHHHTSSTMFATPQTFMNESGKTVERLITQFKIKPSDLWVIHDDLDIGLGDYKIQKGKGPKLHKGILSIEEKLGTDEFWRIRVGVENRSPEERISGESYVLQNFSQEELDILGPVIDNIIEEIHDRLASSD